MEKINISGQCFGRLTALRTVEAPGRKTMWECRCDCGNTVVVALGNLRNGHTQSCGHCAKYEEINGYVRCMTKNGRSFIIDKEDLPLIMPHRWGVDSRGYVSTAGKKLHRYLLAAEPGTVVDHIDGDPTNNRRSNLRVVSQHQNTMNSCTPKSSKTGYKGVCYDKKRGKFMAHIHPNRKMKFLGYFDTAVEAALAYDKAAVIYFGDFACLNFPGNEYQAISG